MTTNQPAQTIRGLYVLGWDEGRTPTVLVGIENVEVVHVRPIPGSTLFEILLSTGEAVQCSGRLPIHWRSSHVPA